MTAIKYFQILALVFSESPHSCSQSPPFLLRHVIGELKKEKHVTLGTRIKSPIRSSLTCAVAKTLMSIHKMKTSEGICPVCDTVTDLALWTDHKGDLY